MKNIVADAFETLGGLVGAGGKTRPKKDLESRPLPATDWPDRPPAAHNQEQLARLKQISNKRITARYQAIQRQIGQLQKKRQNEIPAYVTRVPGDSAQKAVKQLEVKTAGKKPLPPLPPLPVKRAAQKAEKFRGVAG